MGNINFKDFYKVPELNFDISKLRKDLETVLKKKKIRHTWCLKFWCYFLKSNTRRRRIY